MSSEGMDVAYVARLARLRLTSAETVLFQSQLETVLAHIRTLGELDVSDVTPTAYGVATEDVFREDEICEGLTSAVVMANAPDVHEGSFRVPRIVET